MPTLAELMLTDVSDVFLNTNEHAATYTYTAPRTGTTTSVTGVWSVDETPNLDVTRGVENCMSGELLVASSVSVLRSGTFSINGETWNVERVGPVNVGMRVLSLTRQVVSNRGDNFK